MGLEIVKYLIIAICTLMVVTFVQVKMWEDKNAE